MAYKKWLKTEYNINPDDNSTLLPIPRRLSAPYFDYIVSRDLEFKHNKEGQLKCGYFTNILNAKYYGEHADAQIKAKNICRDSWIWRWLLMNIDKAASYECSIYISIIGSYVDYYEYCRSSCYDRTPESTDDDNDDDNNDEWMEVEIRHAIF